AWRHEPAPVPSAGPAAAPDTPPARPPAPRPPEDKDATAKDLELLRGTWQVRSMDFGGKPLPAELLTEFKHTFAGNKLTWDGALGMMSRAGKVTALEGVYQCTFKIDPTTKPKQMDITFHNRKGTPALLAIYAIEGDTLRLCFSSIRRPTEFSSKDKPR